MSKFTEDLATLAANGIKLKGKLIGFPVYHVDGVPIEELCLSTRAFNALRRNQIATIGEILEIDVYKIRNMGSKSAREVKNAVLNYSYDRMTEKQRQEFWREVLA